MNTNHDSASCHAYSIAPTSIVAARCFDHVQLHVADVQSTLEFYCKLGFRCGDYMTTRDDETTCSAGFG